MNNQSVIATTNTRIAHLARCSEAIQAGDCPLITRLAAALPPAPAGTLPPARAAAKEKLQAPTKRPPVTTQKILAAVLESKGLTATDVAARLNCSVASAWYHLDKLVKAGTLTVGADKKYRRTVASAGDSR